MAAGVDAVVVRLRHHHELRRGHRRGEAVRRRHEHRVGGVAPQDHDRHRGARHRRGRRRDGVRQRRVVDQRLREWHQLREHRARPDLLDHRLRQADRLPLEQRHRLLRPPLVDERLQPLGQRRRAVADAEQERRLRQEQVRDRHPPPRGEQREDRAGGVPEHRRPAADRPDDRRHVLRFAERGVRPRVAAGRPGAPVDRDTLQPLRGERGRQRLPRRGGRERAADDHHRCARARAGEGDAGAVRGLDGLHPPSRARPAGARQGRNGRRLVLPRAGSGQRVSGARRTPTPRRAVRPGRTHRVWSGRVPRPG